MASAISHIHTSPHHSVVRVAGDLDLVAAPLLRAALKSADGDPAHRFVVELSAVAFMDCSGLAPLLEARVALASRLRVRDPSRAVMLLLHLAGLDQTFVTHDASAPGEAVGNRIVVEQATGLLMARLGCDAAQASRALLQMSWEQDVPVRDVAVALVSDAQHGSIPSKTAVVLALFLALV